jgi:hypothetical protein
MVSSYKLQSNIAQSLKSAMHQYTNCWNSLDAQEREALETMMVNASHIMTGQSKNRNVWNEIIRPAKEIATDLSREAANQSAVSPHDHDRLIRSVS